MHDPLETLAPWGMRWTARFPGPALGDGLEAADVHSRRLFVGLLGLATGSMLISAGAVALMGDLLASAATVVVAGLVGAILWHFGTTGRHFRALVRTLLTLLYSLAWVGALVDGPANLPMTAQGLWGPFTHVPIAVLLLGTREGVAWAVLHAVTFCLVVAWIPLGLPLPERETPADLLGQYVLTTVMCAGLLLMTLVWFTEQRRLVETDLARERERSDALLRAVLPVRVADRLKAGERVAQRHPEATVLFADLVGFTSWSSRMDASDVVDALDRLFADLDDLAQAHGIEKIKTVGDCYMVVCGVPEPRADHAATMATFALALAERVATHRFGDEPLQVRVGMHSGPLVAGVIGKSRFQYDTWGDTVNTAARMESTGAPGRVQVTEAVRQALGDGFVLEERGAVDVKGKGSMQTWWLVGAAGAARKASA